MMTERPMCDLLKKYRTSGKHNSMNLSQLRELIGTELIFGLSRAIKEATSRTAGPTFSFSATSRH